MNEMPRYLVTSQSLNRVSRPVDAVRAHELVDEWNAEAKTAGVKSDAKIKLDVPAILLRRKKQPPRKENRKREPRK